MPERRMNLLAVVTDQQRRDLVGCYGCEEVRTPAADRIAAEGVRFENAFTVIPICAPARASMLTGLRPVHHGITRNPESGEVGGRDFTRPVVGYHGLLNEEGYRSFHVGKWHIGTELTARDCGAEGVHYPGYGYPGDSNKHFADYLAAHGLPAFGVDEPLAARHRDGSKGTVLLGRQAGGVEASIPYYLAEQAIADVRAAHAEGRPFNLRLDFWGPHVPYLVPEPFFSMYDDVEVEPWPSFVETFERKPRVQRDYLDYWGIQDFTWDEWRRLVRGCFAYTTLIDRQVGRVLDVIDELGIADDTAVLYTADHGGMVGAHRLCDKGPFLYDEILRVPFMARIPGITTPGARIDDFITILDLPPTLLELGGVSVPDGLDGRSLVPLIRGEERREPVLFGEFHGHQSPFCQRVVRTTSHKYIFNASDVDELYDLAADPHELVNRVDDAACADVLRDLRARLHAFLKESRDPILRWFVDTRLR